MILAFFLGKTGKRSFHQIEAEESRETERELRKKSSTRVLSEHFVNKNRGLLGPRIGRTPPRTFSPPINIKASILGLSKILHKILLDFNFFL